MQNRFSILTALTFSLALSMDLSAQQSVQTGRVSQARMKAEAHKNVPQGPTAAQLAAVTKEIEAAMKEKSALESGPPVDIAAPTDAKALTPEAQQAAEAKRQAAQAKADAAQGRVDSAMKEMVVLNDQAQAAAGGTVQQPPDTIAAAVELNRARADYNQAVSNTLEAQDDLAKAQADADNDAIAKARNVLTQDKKDEEAAKQVLADDLKDLQQKAEDAADPSKVAPKGCVTAQKYRWYFPVWRGICQEDPQSIVDFFGAAKKVEFGTSVQYVYNQTQSSNQVGADLMTATFLPGFQAILGANVTQGSAAKDTTTSTAATLLPRSVAQDTTTQASTTDDLSTAISKLQAGGDFNIRFPAPLMFSQGSFSTFYALFAPAVGFTVNGLTDQSTITEASDYSASIPFEIYGETRSIEKKDGVSNAKFYIDVRGGENIISPKLAKDLGFTGHTYASGQLSAGIQFSNSISVGVQYFYGPKNTFIDANSNKQVANLGGFHLIVSFAHTP